MAPSEKPSKVSPNDVQQGAVTTNKDHSFAQQHRKFS